MLYRKIGSSDLEVSEICLGSWLTYGGAIGREQAEACVAKAFELGINFIDTANAYSGGGAESFLGEVLADRPRFVRARDKAVLPHDPGRSGLVARAGLQTDRRVTHAPADGLRRPLPVSSLRLGYATPRDDGGAHRGRQAGQGALYRLQ